MQSFKIFMLLCFSSINLSIHAQATAWQNQIPSSLEPFSNDVQQLARLTGQGIIIYAHQPQSLLLPTFKQQHAVQTQFYSAALIVPIKAEQVRNTLSDYANYVKIFPNLRSAKLKKIDQQRQEVVYQVHIPTPIPVLNFKENVVMQHHLDTQRIASLIIDAPLPYAVGQIEWFDLGNQNTLITLTQWADLNHSKGFLIGKILNALPDAKLGLPTSANAFLLEALQRKFKPNLNIQQITDFPEPHWSTAQWQQITTLSKKAQAPVLYIYPPFNTHYTGKMEQLRFSSSYMYLNQNAQQLQPWIQPEAFQSLFPNIIKKTNVQTLASKQQQAHYNVSVGLGVIRIPFDFHLRFQQPSPLNTKFYATGGDIKNIQGQMKIQNLNLNQGSLFQLTSAIKIDQTAPFLIRAMRSLPYYEMLPAVGGNTVYARKIQQKIK